MAIGWRMRDKTKKTLRRWSARFSVERLEPRLMLAGEVSPLVINLNFGDDLAANAPARAAFERAAEFWEGVLFDPVVLNIDAELTEEGFFGENVLGLSESTMVRFLYGDVRGRLIADGSIKRNPLRDSVGAISVGVVGGEMMLDLPYEEDVRADVDMNVVGTGSGALIEVQGTGEGTTFSEKQLHELTSMALKGIAELSILQTEAISAALEKNKRG